MAFPLVASLVGLGSRLVLPRILPYLNRIVSLSMFAVGSYSIGSIPHSSSKIETGSYSSSVPVSSDDDFSNSVVPSDVLSDYNEALSSISDVVSSSSSSLNQDLDFDVPKVSPSFPSGSVGLLDVLQNSNSNVVDAINNLVQSVYDLQKVITVSTSLIASVLDNGFTALSLSNVSSLPSSSPINNSVNVDTSPIATVLKPSIDAIADKLNSQKKYYDKVLTPSDVVDLDGNLIVSGVDSVDLDKIKNAVISSVATDINNFSADDLDDDLDFNDLIQNIDLSKLFQFLRVSSQLQNNGDV